MAESKLGTIGWLDLTVDDAAGVRDFYQAVTGWTSSPVDMGGYEDFSMIPPTGGDAVAGVCHARKSNESLPPVWLPYIIVENLQKSMEACRERGGAVVSGPRDYGDQGSYCIIRDPAGAHIGLFQSGSTQPRQP